MKIIFNLSKPSRFSKTLKVYCYCSCYCLLFLLFTTCKKEINADKNSPSSIKYFKGGLNDKVKKVEKTMDGGFIYCGLTGDSSNYDVFMMKVDADRNRQWYHTYGGCFYDEFKHAIQCAVGEYISY